MKNICLKKLISICLALVMVLGIFATAALADEPEVDLTLGPTVIADPSSPTGYTVHFVYHDETAQQVWFCGDLMLSNWADTTDTELYTPFEYKPGLMRRGGAQFKEEMTRYEGGYWVYDVPLCAGANQYWFNIDNGTRMMPDPANHPQWSPNSNWDRKNAYNAVYVPYDAEKQNFEPLRQRALYENPRADEKRGTWSYVPVDVPGYATPRYMGVYLPYGYDPDRVKPYKTIYMLHGGGQDESDWMGIGSVQNIMDNLLAEGLTEPAIIVTPSSAYFGTNYVNLFDTILPYVESHYNVSSYAFDRSFAGLSAGASTTAGIIKTNSSKFGYYGIFSGMGCPATVRQGQNLNVPFTFFGFGLNEDTTGSRASEIAALADTDVNFKSVMVAGAHDFNTWCQLCTTYIRDYLWKPTAFNSPLSLVTTAADKVQAGDSFDIGTSLLGPTSSNTAQLNYSFDAAKFEYVGFTPAEGVIVLNSEIEEGTAKFVVMVSDYNMQNLGTLTLKAKADVTLANEWNTISLTANYVEKSESGSKSIVPISGSVPFTTIGIKGDTNGDSIVNLLDLSDMIDWFGVTSDDAQWNSLYIFFDYNNNGEIDISDIALVAQMI